jgi:hypothetical protein
MNRLPLFPVFSASLTSALLMPSAAQLDGRSCL